MIDIIDPNLNLPQPPAAPSVEPVEPIKPETVGIEEERLKDKQRGGKEESKQQRREKDTVEISQLKDTPDDDTPQTAHDDSETEADDGYIDILI